MPRFDAPIDHTLSVQAWWLQFPLTPAIAGLGRDVLVQNCSVDDKLDGFLDANARAGGKAIDSEAFGIVARDNVPPDVPSIVTTEGVAELSSHRCELGLRIVTPVTCRGRLD